MKIKLYENLMVEQCSWGETITPYIRIFLNVGYKQIFWFTVEVQDKSFNFRNPLTSILKALESETVASAKYYRLKARK